jgi:hypothetical protein
MPSPTLYSGFITDKLATVLSIFAIFQIADPENSFWTDVTVLLYAPYISLSIAYNIAMTLVIVGRIFYMRKQVASVLGQEYAKSYTSLASMFIESGAIYSIVGLIFIVAYAVDSDVQYLVLQCLEQAVVSQSNLIESAINVLTPCDFVLGHLPRTDNPPSFLGPRVEL